MFLWVERRKMGVEHHHCQDEQWFFFDECHNAYEDTHPVQSLKCRSLSIGMAFTLRVASSPLPWTKMRSCLPFRANLIALLLLPLTVAAQESRNGPKIGLGIATQTAGQFLAWSGLPKLGPVAGWSFEAPVTSQVSLLIEPMYIGKGSVTVNSQLKTRSSVALNYVELPLLLKVSTNPDPQGLFLTGGLMYGYFLHGKIKNFRDGNLESTYDFSPTGTTNRSQWSAAVGLGHEKGHWMLELRGQSSLNTFDRLVRSHNVVYSVQVAWRFATQAEKEQKRLEKEALD